MLRIAKKYLPVFENMDRGGVFDFIPDEMKMALLFSDIFPEGYQKLIEESSVVYERKKMQSGIYRRNFEIRAVEAGLIFFLLIIF